MHYEINVSLRGRHLFATSEHSCNDDHSFIDAYAEIVSRFPQSEGFSVSATKCERIGNFLTVDQIATMAQQVTKERLDYIRNVSEGTEKFRA